MEYNVRKIGDTFDVGQNEVFIFVNATSEICKITSCDALEVVPTPDFAPGASQFAIVKPGAAAGPHDYTHTCPLHIVDNPKIIVGG
jgi:hypothetical protein